jgi:hypothetical protein
LEKLIIRERINPRAADIHALKRTAENPFPVGEWQLKIA